MPLIVCLTLAPAGGPADIIRVPADQPTLVAAVGAAADGDTIVIAPGTHAGAPITGRTLAIRSEDAENPATVTGLIMSASAIVVSDLVVERYSSAFQSLVAQGGTLTLERTESVEKIVLTGVQSFTATDSTWSELAAEEVASLAATRCGGYRIAHTRSTVGGRLEAIDCEFSYIEATLVDDVLVTGGNSYTITVEGCATFAASGGLPRAIGVSQGGSVVIDGGAQVESIQLEDVLAASLTDTTGGWISLDRVDETVVTRCSLRGSDGFPGECHSIPFPPGCAGSGPSNGSAAIAARAVGLLEIVDSALRGGDGAAPFAGCCGTWFGSAPACAVSLSDGSHATASHSSLTPGNSPFPEFSLTCFDATSTLDRLDPGVGWLTR